MSKRILSYVTKSGNPQGTGGFGLFAADYTSGDESPLLYRGRFHDGKIVDLSIGSVVLRLLRIKQNPPKG